jgi:hypothetical protein
VTATALSEHLGLSRQRISALADEGVIERLPDGRFNQDRARLGYLALLRDPARRAAKSQAQSAFTDAKTALVMLRVREREGRLIELNEAVATVQEMTALFRTGVEGLPAAIGGRDLGERRRVEVLCRRLLEQSLMKAGSERPNPVSRQLHASRRKPNDA